MVGNTPVLIQTIFDLANSAIAQNQFPYVSIVAKDGVIIATGINQVDQKLDKSLHGDVIAIRNAQAALETGDLTGYSLYSLFEPTILSFDLALFTGIRHFVWCLDRQDLPTNDYFPIPYGPREYDADRPGHITIERDILRPQALEIMQHALTQRLSLLVHPHSPESL